MMRFLRLFLLLFFLLARPVLAESPVNAYLFYGEGCPHCAKESQFLKQLQIKYSGLNVIELEIYYNRENSRLMQAAAKKLGADAGGVPFLVIGDKSYVGFAEGFYADEIEVRVAECSQTDCGDIVAPLRPAGPAAASVKPSPPAKTPAAAGTVSLPLFGSVDLARLSLPAITVMLAFLDGFNPCAMWALMFLISLLLGMKDRRRMWLLGGTFIVTSALVYFLFLAAWLNLFLVIGFVIWIRLAVGLVALATGGYYLYDFWVNRSGACRVSGQAAKQRFFLRAKSLTGKKQLVLALAGIVLLAAAVNLVELICSAGLPAVYTKILTLVQLPRWQYYLYLLLYILVFMLDDLFVFITAMVTLKAVGIQGKYSRFSHLAGGLLMLVIGLLLVFKPEWLMFG